MKKSLLHYCKVFMIAGWALLSGVTAISAAPRSAGKGFTHRSQKTVLQQTPPGHATHMPVTYAYVVEWPDFKVVTQYQIKKILLPLKPASFTADNTSDAIAVTPNGRFVFTVTYGSNTISEYRVSPDGTLTPFTPVAKTPDASMEFITLTPDGRFLYLTGATGNIEAYRVAQNGMLTALSPTGVPGGLGPIDVVMAPSQKNLYVLALNGGENMGFSCMIWQYKINKNGTLTPLDPTAAFAHMIRPNSMAIDPTGKFVYVTHQNGIAVLSVHSDGTLSETDPLTGTNGTSSSLVISHSGRFAYSVEMVGDSENGSALLFDYYQPDSSGKLNQERSWLVGDRGMLSELAFSTDGNPPDFRRLALSPDNRTLIALDAAYNHIYCYALGKDGAIVSHSPSSIVNDNNPASIGFATRK